MPTQSAVVMLWLCSLAGGLPLLVTSRPQSAALWRPWPRAAWHAAGIAAIALAAGQAALASGPLDPAARARRLNREWMVGTTPLEPLSGSGAFRWTGRRAYFEWPVTAEWLVLRFWAPHPDITARPVHVAVTTVCGVVFDADLGGAEAVSLALRLPQGLSRVGSRSRCRIPGGPSAAGSPATREGLAWVSPPTSRGMKKGSPTPGAISRPARPDRAASQGRLRQIAVTRSSKTLTQAYADSRVAFQSSGEGLHKNSRVEE